MMPWTRRARNHRRAEITLGYLKDLRAEMQGRIDMADLDFDDVIYRSRDAADTLIKIREDG